MVNFTDIHSLFFESLSVVFLERDITKVAKIRHDGLGDAIFFHIDNNY
jgi:hypothetical protein